MNAKAFNFSFQGASHIKKNKECQDASLSYQDEKCTIAVVCDGHGGDDYVRSAVGSSNACAVAVRNIREFFSGIDRDTFFADPEHLLKNLEASIINDWNESIYEYHKTHPFTYEEIAGVSEKAKKKYIDAGRIESAYGTTLIAVALNKDFWFGIHIGDGKCVAVNRKGDFKQPIPWDPKCFLNATTSICDSDAIDRFRHFYSDKMPAALFVGSDGIDDCFKNNDQLNNLYKTVLYSFGTTEFEEACAGLADYLPRLSAKGSGDDVSIAAILDLERIPELPVVKEYDMEKEKARVEESARIEAEKNEAEKRRVQEEHARFQNQNRKPEAIPSNTNASTVSQPVNGEAGSQDNTVQTADIQSEASGDEQTETVVNEISTHDSTEAPEANEEQVVAAESDETEKEFSENQSMEEPADSHEADASVTSDETPVSNDSGIVSEDRTADTDLAEEKESAASGSQNPEETIPASEEPPVESCEELTSGSIDIKTEQLVDEGEKAVVNPFDRPEEVKI